MLAVSTAWNADRHSGWADAAAELLSLGHQRIALDGAALHPDAAAAGRIVRAAKGEIVALFAPPPRRDDAGRIASEGLVSPRSEKRKTAVDAAYTAARAAMDGGTARVVLRAGELPGLDPSRESRWLGRLAREGRTAALDDEIRAAIASDVRDRERFLEALCRALFDLTRKVPDAQWLLETPARTAGLPAPAEAELVFAELPGRKVGYWHDTGHAARLAALGVIPAEEWLARLGRFTGGVTVGDWSTSASDLPPGAGVVDWTSLAAQLSPAMPRVLRLDPSFGAPLLDDALREAESLGL